MSEIISTHDLFIGYKKSGKAKTVAGPLNLSLQAGELVCIIGPNGAGKTTLLKTLSGVNKPLQGEVVIKGKNVTTYKSPDLAKKLGVVLTDQITVGNLSVYAMVALGRYPYTNWLGGLSVLDEEQINWALEVTHTSAYINRQFNELSDGERQKVMIAKALAQDTELILMDEPTAHLDLPNRVEIFRLLKKLAKDTNKAILLTTHELDLAIQIADKIWLINPAEHSANSSITSENRSISLNQILHGTPEDLILNGTFEKAFRGEGLAFDKSTGRFRILGEHKENINLEGDGIEAYWTIRALERKGFQVNNQFPSHIRIEIDNKRKGWSCQIYDRSYSIFSIEELLKIIDSAKSEEINKTRLTINQL